MNIRDYAIGTNRPDARRTDGPGKTRSADEQAATGAGSAGRPASVSADRVEISEAARAALAGRTDAGPADLNAAREALRSQPTTLDPSRKAELQQRVADGYYQQDAVVAQAAEQLAADLRGEAPGPVERS